MSEIHGGIRGKSIRSNASSHTGKAVVFAMDIKDCFPSIGPHEVGLLLQKLGFADDASEILVKLTTWKFQIPQGAHTSMALANLALAGIDLRIKGLALIHGFSYTRYVDDISISGSWRLLKFRKLLLRIIEYEGFRVKANKVETMHRGMRQVVTKLVVNGKVNLPREKREAIRKELQPLLRDPSISMTPSSLGRLHWLKFINPTVGEPLVEKLKGAVARTGHNI